ncbi:MAG: hypothetical protein JXA10_03525 [Anaerolineae bacterium]|nr:hypothetical protein [Anaerolineae bacterium]
MFTIALTIITMLIFIGLLNIGPHNNDPYTSVRVTVVPGIMTIIFILIPVIWLASLPDCSPPPDDPYDTDQCTFQALSIIITFLGPAILSFLFFITALIKARRAQIDAIENAR